MKVDGIIDDYAVAGAVGAIFYVEPFSTEDVDVLVNFGSAKSLLVSLEPILEYLKSHGYTEFEHGAVVIEGWPVQFLPVSDDLTRDALTTAQRIKYDDTLSVRVLRPEYLAAEAVKVGRPKDLQRISLLLENESFNRQSFEDILRVHGLEQKWTGIAQMLQINSDRQSRGLHR